MDDFKPERSVTSHPKPSTGTLRMGSLSAIIHGCILLAMIGVVHSSEVVAPYRLPGTAKGMHILTYFSPDGSSAKAAAPVMVKPHAARRSAAAPKIALPEVAAKSKATAGTSTTSGSSGRGDGEISIALPQKFPWPRPELDSMAHGAKGDVILDATIDEQGRIASLVITQGVSSAVDAAVLATVRDGSSLRL